MGAKIKKYVKWTFDSFIWLAVLLFVIDLVTKLVVHANRDFILSQSEQGIILIPGFLAINYTLNPGAAFGMGFDNPEINRWIYIVVATIGAAIMITIYTLKFKKMNRYMKACLMMMVVGAIGNLVDRLFFSFSDFAVVDWINFYGIWAYNFNIADSSIVVGTIMLVVYLIIAEIKENRTKEMLEINKENSEVTNEENKE